MFRVQPRKRGVDEPSSIYTQFLGRIDKVAEKTGIAYLEAVRRSILESPVKVREHIKTYDKGNVLMKEIHRETLPPDIRGAGIVTLTPWLRHGRCFILRGDDKDP